MNTLNRRSSRDELVKVEFVQTAFAAGCALAVFSYVWNNIEEIKEKQAIAVNQTMTKQTNDIKSAQETQKANIARIQEEQRQNILKAQEATKRK